MKVPGIPFHQGANQYTDRDGKKYGIAIHNTSNTASDEAESSYADHRTDGTSSHFYCDDDSVIQSIDTNYRAGHAGSYEGNEHAIAYEITGTNDKSRQWWLDNVAWSKLAYTIAYQLQHDPDLEGFQIRRATVDEMRNNPRIKAFYGHNDMRLAWGGTTHTDPGPNFPWDKLISSVKAAMSGQEDLVTTQAEFNNFMIGALKDPTVSASMRAFPWQYVGGGIPDNYSALKVFFETWLNSQENEAKIDALTKAVNTIVSQNLDGDIAAISAKFEAARQEQAQKLADLMAQVDQVDENVMTTLGATDDPTTIAERLKAALGDKAEAVFRAGLGEA